MKITTGSLPLAIVGVLLAGPAWAEQKPYTLKDLQALEQREAWPELLAHLNDVPPAERSADWNRVVERACLPDGMEDYLEERCHNALSSVLNSEPQNMEFAWKAGKWARRHRASWAAVPFFARAVQKAGDPRCKDGDVLEAVVSGLGLPADRSADVVKQSQKLAFQRCWPDTKESVKNAFGRQEGYFRDNTCGALKQKGALSKLQAARCDEKK